MYDIRIFPMLDVKPRHSELPPIFIDSPLYTIFYFNFFYLPECPVSYGKMCEFYSRRLRTDPSA